MVKHDYNKLINYESLRGESMYEKIDLEESQNKLVKNNQRSVLTLRLIKLESDFLDAKLNV